MRKTFLLHYVSKSNSSNGMHAPFSPAGTLLYCSHSKPTQKLDTQQSLSSRDIRFSRTVSQG